MGPPFQFMLYTASKKWETEVAMEQKWKVNNWKDKITEMAKEIDALKYRLVYYLVDIDNAA